MSQEVETSAISIVSEKKTKNFQKHFPAPVVMYLKFHSGKMALNQGFSHNAIICMIGYSKYSPPQNANLISSRVDISKANIIQRNC